MCIRFYTATKLSAKGGWTWLPKKGTGFAMQYGRCLSCNVGKRGSSIPSQPESRFLGVDKTDTACVVKG